ncbi:MAG: hypothetical protein LBV06_08410 [Propionibacteriaceae bacterium]|jgi:hypothetical protein|nr:hypothetical protein [Propionibacteriaceae bacterium]
MNLNTALREAIYEELSRQGIGLREAARRMARSHHWLGTKLRGTSPLTTADVEEITTSLGLDPLAFFIEVCSQAKQSQVDPPSEQDRPEP